MKNEFTKGEWEISKRNNQGIRILINESNPIETEVICSISGNPDDKNVLANAKLISASPLLLEALTDLLASYKMNVKKPNESEFVINAELAIKKATT